MAVTDAAREMRGAIEVGAEPLSIDDIVALSEGVVIPQLSRAARERMQSSADLVARLHEDEAHIYGVTTSVGASVGTHVPRLFSRDLSLNIQRMHGCGTGQHLSEQQTAAALAVRLSSLSRGLSGVRPVVADRLIGFLEHRVLPLIPSEGSVGASGDLTPLSYVAAALVGEREVRFNDEIVDASEALEAIGAAPLTLGPREVLALMNGTSVATAIACLAWVRARELSRLAACLTAMCSELVHGNPTHFDAFVHGAKPHVGQVLAARWIREDLGYDRSETRAGVRLQDRYSIRYAGVNRLSRRSSTGSATTRSSMSKPGGSFTVVISMEATSASLATPSKWRLPTSHAFSIASSRFCAIPPKMTGSQRTWSVCKTRSHALITASRRSQSRHRPWLPRHSK